MKPVVTVKFEVEAKLLCKFCGTRILRTKTREINEDQYFPAGSESSIIRVDNEVLELMDQASIEADMRGWRTIEGEYLSINGNHVYNEPVIECSRCRDKNGTIQANERAKKLIGDQRKSE